MKTGFTLVELLVVIAIIGLLASIVFAAVAKGRDLSKIARALTEMKELGVIMDYTKGVTGKGIGFTTGSWWSRANCVVVGGPNPDLRGTNAYCYPEWVNALQLIGTAAGAPYNDLSRFNRDPWGSPYLLDENETEPPGPDPFGNPIDPCRNDYLKSAGPNGIINGYGPGGDGDDIDYTVPLSMPQCTHP